MSQDPPLPRVVQVNVVTLANALIAVLPAGLVFFLAYGRYDRAFSDQVVFLHFVGGLVLGALLGVTTALALGTRAILFQVVGLAVLWPLTLVAVVNRRKWQGNRHAVFNGGALGIGVAVMMGFTMLLFPRFRELTPAAAAQATLLSMGLAGLFFGLGLLAGDGVRRKAPFQAAFGGAAILVAPLVFLVEFFAQGAWLWAVLFPLYGLVVGVAAERRLMIQGLTEEARRERRRRRRAGEPG